MSVGENLKALRKKKGVTQREVAKMLSAIETEIKQPSLNVALALAKYYGITVEELCR